MKISRKKAQFIIYLFLFKRSVLVTANFNVYKNRDILNMMVYICTVLTYLNKEGVRFAVSL